MARSFPRRRLLQAGAAVFAFPKVVPASIWGANERLNVAAIGVGGKGDVDIGGCATENIVALCDVDQKTGAPAFKKHPDAKRYKDFRVMLQELEKSIDAVTVSTPDHTHAPAAIMAMKMGKHVYCQKPLTHSVFEAREMARIARERKVATQMGNQGHANPETRRLVEIIRSGALGKVSEVHVWTDRPIWPQGIPRPKDAEAVPAHVDWDLWLGPAPMRPYHSCYLPFKWRGWWDFGTGALGDMGCHNLDLAFFSLGLRDPLKVTADSEPVNPETAPKWSVITYEFPGVKLTWYDGGKKPPKALVDKTLPTNGVIMIGDKDTLYVPNFWGAGSFVKSGREMADFKDVPETLPRRTETFDANHYQEWIAACKGGPAALSNFDHAGPMTEAVLLGNVAVRAGGTIEYDSAAMKVTNNSAANGFLKREYRAGWSI